MPFNTDAVEIASVPPSEAIEALELLFCDLGAIDRGRQIEALMADGASMEGLLRARRGGRQVGVVFSQLQPGRTAIVWPPRLVDDEPSHTADQLLAATNQRLAAAHSSLAHVSLETVSETDDATLTAGGYRSLAKLLYMACEAEDFPADRPRGVLEFEPYSQMNHDRFVRVVEATYQRTLDCPGLNDVRRTEDVLEGYRHTGVFEPTRWLIVRHQGADVGCLIVTDHPEHATCELVYMGVTAMSRGHGWGREIARHAQWLTAKAAQPRLVLAVDAANRPAIDMYTSVGFHAWDRRSVYARVFDSAVEGG